LAEEAENGRIPACLVCPRSSGIQNGGVDRMSGMSSMLRIALYRDASSPNKRE